MTIKQVSLTLLSLVCIFATGLAEETTTPALDLPTPEKKIAALILFDRTSPLVVAASNGWATSASATVTYPNLLATLETSESDFQKLEEAYGSIECDCNITEFPKTVKILRSRYHHYDNNPNKSSWLPIQVNCEQLISLLEKQTPEHQKDLAEKLSANK